MATEEMVTITAQRYTTLVRHEAELDFLTSCLFENAHLSWDGKSISADTESINTVLKLMYPNVYKNYVNKLIKQKEGE